MSEFSYAWARAQWLKEQHGGTILDRSGDAYTWIPDEYDEALAQIVLEGMDAKLMAFPTATPAAQYIFDILMANFPPTHLGYIRAEKAELQKRLKSKEKEIEAWEEKLRGQRFDFMFLYNQGFAHEEDVDNFVEEWHSGDSNLTLREYLGMSEQVYKRWVEKASLPER